MLDHGGVFKTFKTAISKVVDVLPLFPLTSHFLQCMFNCMLCSNYSDREILFSLEPAEIICVTYQN